NTRVNGGKIESSWDLLEGKTVLGLDGYERNWRAETTTRSLHMTVMSGMMSTSSMSPAYRTQESIPDVTTRNAGLYLEQENKFLDNLQSTLGLRYDATESTAGRDRRQLYNVYYPQYNNAYLFGYYSGAVLQNRFERELYLPPANPVNRSFG
ncbi:MAG: TonB-dependent receptor, partial [Leptospiraceae bacterium]|nr:TonB-dependent receptor [Leptospiraceae bacterium]